jgi:CPA1 family monovalent cation:H+ antiporter
MVHSVQAGGLDVALLTALLAAVAGAALVARRSELPTTVILLLVGLVTSEVGWWLTFSLRPDTILYLFLPPLLFEGAFRLDLRLLRQSLTSILFLAVPGVLVSTAVAGAVVHTALGLPWIAALLFGAITAATDPVAVIAVFKKVGVPARLAIIIEGEGLFNDGTALVLFGALLTVTTGHLSASDQIAMVTLKIMGGSAVGLALGYMASELTALIDDHLVEMLLSTALAYGAYVGADVLGSSGVLATVCAGLVLGSYGRQRGMSEATIRLLDDLWEYLAYFANAVLFLLIGVTIPGHDLVHAPAVVAAGVSAVLLGRAVVVYGLGAPIMRGGRGLPVVYRHVLFWGGLRGAVCVAATLSLPVHLPYRAEIQTLAYGATVFTVFVQGVSLAPLVRRLRLWMELTDGSAGGQAGSVRGGARDAV